MENPINLESAACPEDLAKLFESHLEPILGTAYGVALRPTRNPADAEDLVQEAAVKSFCGFRAEKRFASNQLRVADDFRH